MNRKIRSDDKLSLLPIEDRQRLLTWIEASSYEKVTKLAAKPRPEGLDLHTSITALSGFYMKQATAMPMEVTLDDNIEPRPDLPAGMSPALLHTTVNVLQQKGLHESLSPHANLTEQKSVANFALRLAALKVKHDYLILARDRFQYSAAREALKKMPELIKIYSDPKLDDDEKADLIRLELFKCLAE